MKQNKTTLSEAQLYSIISESVKKILEDKWYDDWYDDDDYEDDEYDTSYACDLADEIKNGKHDSEIFDDEWVEEVSGTMDIDHDIIDRAVSDRRKIVDRDYALKYGKNPGHVDRGTFDYQRDYPRDSNPNIRDHSNRGSNEVIGKNGFKNDDIEHGWFSQDMKRTDPALQKAWFKKNDKWRSYGQVERANRREFGALIDADKKPLHRKGSLNREIPNTK